VGLAAACGKSEGGAAPIARADLPKALADLVCDSLAPCCRDAEQPFDLATCKSAWVAQVNASYDDFDETRVEYDAAAAGDCLALVRGHIRCGEIDVDGDDDQSCQTIFRGKVAAGQPCNASEECQHSPGQAFGCAYDDALQSSRCQIYELLNQPRGFEGDVCSETCDDAEDGTCEIFVSPNDPAPRPPATTCHTSDGLYCTTDGISQTPRCTPLASAGQACNAVGDNCGHGSVCDYGTLLCSLPRANGEPCDASNLCQSEFCSEQGLCGPRVLSAAECSVELSID
jgi:hypothetical protein